MAFQKKKLNMILGVYEIFCSIASMKKKSIDDGELKIPGSVGRDCKVYPAYDLIHNNEHPDQRGTNK